MAKRGRPAGSFAWGARLCATIADRLVHENDALAITVAAKAALDATYTSVPQFDKQNWRDGSDAAAVELVRQTVYKVRKIQCLDVRPGDPEPPGGPVQPSAALMHLARGALKKQKEDLILSKIRSESEGQTANALRIQREIDKLNKSVKQAQAFAESQKHEGAEWRTAASERGVYLSNEENERVRKQQGTARRAALKDEEKSRTPKPFAAPKNK